MPCYAALPMIYSNFTAYRQS